MQNTFRDYRGEDTLAPELIGKQLLVYDDGYVVLSKGDARYQVRYGLQSILFTNFKSAIDEFRDCMLHCFRSESLVDRDA